MILSPFEISMLVAIGLAAGVLGGLLGIGGSIIMIPAMAVVFHDRQWHEQHLYQAAAMVVNVAVALPATSRHYRAGAIRKDLFLIMLPATLVTIVIGVFVSNLFSGRILQQLFGVFLLYVIVSNLLKLISRNEDHAPERAKVTIPRGGFVGGVMGFMAGLLGIGGGGIAVPLAHVVCKLPLRQCIGASAAVMGITAGVGALLKLATLDQHDRSWTMAMILALCLAPTALLGGFLGASLTHKLPLNIVRLIFTGMMLIIAVRMLAA